ncbi:MAG: hypothetical protein ABFS46_17455 [Myxococcota bacterium]
MVRKVEETLLPPVSGWEERDRTRAAGSDVEPVDGPFSDRTRVRVTLLATRLPREDRLGEVGRGVLIDRLVIGGPLRIAIEGAPAFVTSPVRGLQGLGPDSVQVTTTHSVYRLERSRASGAADPDPVEIALQQAEGDDPLQTAGSPEPNPNDDSTSFVPLSKLAPLGSSPFANGARLRISRLKTRDPLSERLGELGTGRVLDRLEVGEMVRLSIEGGATFVTSPLRTVHRIGENLVEIETANSTYRLRTLEEGCDAS